MDLYATLGLPRNATTDDIRKAYRKLSKKHHPDMKNGDKAKFEEIKTAHDILTDDERRARYDRTGDVSEKVPEGNADAELYNFVTQLMSNAVQSIMDIESQSLLDIMKNMLAQQKSGVDDTNKTLQRSLTNLEKVKSKIKRKEGDNVLASLMQSQIQFLQTNVDKTAQQLVVMTRAEEMLNDYEYDVKKRSETLQSDTKHYWYGSHLGFAQF